MKIIRQLSEIKQKFRKPVLTVGIFDGVHLGHQKIIQQVVRQAKIIGGVSIVLTFAPHPLRHLKNSYRIPLISSLKQRLDLLNRLNVDVCLLLDFNQKLSGICAQDFIKEILVNLLGINYLIVGKNFRFGKDRKGTIALLKRLSKIHGFKLRAISPIKHSGEVVSSSRIRRLIQQGKIIAANKLLGRRFSIYGRVKKGCLRGRILGYPTANIRPEQEIVPLSGVYAVFVKLADKIFRGMLNIGTRPTFELRKAPEALIEVHIFNFQRNIYGQRMEVFFVERIRPEKRFFSHQALRERIKQDERRAKKLLRTESPSPLKP